MVYPWRHDLDVRAAHANRSDPLTLDIVPFDLPDQPTEVWRRGDVRVLAGQVRHEPVHPAVGFRVETLDGIVAVTGDTLVCDALAAGADVLVYKRMRFEKIRQRPPHLKFILDYHADTPRIGAQAAELGVPTLVLTHLIPPPESDDDVQAFVDDIRTAGYAGDAGLISRRAESAFPG